MDLNYTFFVKKVYLFSKLPLHVFIIFNFLSVSLTSSPPNLWYCGQNPGTYLGLARTLPSGYLPDSQPRHFPWPWDFCVQLTLVHLSTCAVPEEGKPNKLNLQAKTECFTFLCPQPLRPSHTQLYPYVLCLYPLALCLCCSILQ